jgi:hypothetical protein
MLVVAACGTDSVTAPPDVAARQIARGVFSATAPNCWAYQTSDPGFPGSYDGTMAIGCNAEALAIGIATIEWGAGWSDYAYGHYSQIAGGDELGLFASTNCAGNGTQLYPYTYRVTLNDSSQFLNAFFRYACDPLQ